MARRKRTRRSNPAGLAGLGVVTTLAIGAATAAAALIPTVSKLFGWGTATPATPVPVQDYQKDLQTAVALKTQAAVAAKNAQSAAQVAQAQLQAAQTQGQLQLQTAQAQGQSAVQVEQIKAASATRMLLYGAGAVAVGLGIYMVVKSLRKKKGATP